MSDRPSRLVRSLLAAAFTLLLAAAAAGLLAYQVIARDRHPFLEEPSVGGLLPWMGTAALAALPIALVAAVVAALTRRIAWSLVLSVLLLFGGFHWLRESVSDEKKVERTLSYPEWEALAPSFASPDAAALDAAAESPSAERPNIVLITIDTLRWDHMGYAGYERETSPRIDALARRGTIFEHGLAQAPATRSSMASMMTGLYPHVIEIERGRGGRGRQGAFVSDGFHLLAERLGAAGYDTAAFITNPYLRAVNGFGQGFETYDESALYGGVGETRLRNAADVVDAAERWLDERRLPERSSTAPFFLWVHILDPHHPYESVEPGPWEDVESERFQAFDADYRAMAVDAMTAHFEALAAGETEWREGELEYLIGRYDAEILWSDRQVGRLLERLEDAGATLENTVVVVTSDHGEEFLDHGGLLHSHTLHDELVRVPFVVAGPGFEAGVRSGDQARLIDIAPTALAAAGLTPPAADMLDGVPLQDAEAEPSADGLSFLSLVEVALRTPERKLLGDFRTYDLMCRSDGFEPYEDLRGLFVARYRHGIKPGRVFDIAADPGETDAIDDAAEVHRMQCRLADKLAAHPPVVLQTTAGAEGLSDEDREQLRALGYVE